MYVCLSGRTCLSVCMYIIMVYYVCCAFMWMVGGACICHPHPDIRGHKHCTGKIE